MILPSRPFGVIASSRPRVVVAGGGSDFTAGEFNFNDVSDGAVALETNTVTFTHGGTLAISTSNTIDAVGQILKNGVSQTAYYSQVGAETQNANFSGAWMYVGMYSIINVSNGDTLKFTFEEDPSPPASSATITIRNANFSGTVVDTFTWTKAGCYLTTTVVEYMGLADNGPELTAMRQLREYYIGVPGYADLIQEYYQTSPVIITAINALADPSVEYTYIYNTVVVVMNHVNGGEWQQAHDLYMAMYNDLKTRYLG
jgi:hypothetical protein